MGTRLKRFLGNCRRVAVRTTGGASLLTAEGGSTTGLNCFRGEINGQAATGVATATRATGNVQGGMTYDIGGSDGSLTYMGQQWEPAPSSQVDTPASYLEACRTAG